MIWCSSDSGSSDLGSDSAGVLCVHADFGYSLTVGGDVWLHSPLDAPLSLRCGGQQLSVQNKTLAPTGSAINISGANSTLGPWAGVQRQYAGAAPMSHCAATAAVLHYPDAGVFEFRLSFDGAALNGTAAIQLPTSHTQLPQFSGGPTSTSFPSFETAASGGGGGGSPNLGFVEFRGETLSSGFVTSAASGFPKGYEGGLQSGPLALFSASAAADDPHPPALVIGPISDAKDTVLTLHDGALSVGASGYLESLPAGFQTRVAIAVRRGLSAAYSAYGSAALRVAGSVPKMTLDADPLDRQLHYLTDNGAYYGAENASFAQFLHKTIISPRQARDKHD